MTTATFVDFETDFAPLFDPPLQAVEVVHDLSADDFERHYRRPGRPVIIDGLTAAWPALSRWTDPGYLEERAGHRTLFVRDLDAGSIDLAGYQEAYREVSFGEFARRVLGDDPPAWYLTQALVIRGRGLNALLRRSTSPAWLPELADDIALPPYWPAGSLTEANLWMGPGGHASGLHYDEFDNLNAAVHGSKRWLLFPRSQTDALLSAGGSGIDTIARGFHEREANRLAARRSEAQGFQCVTRPGQMLFVPAGMWHQVFSGPGASLAVNFWYLRLPRDMHNCAVLHARRITGFHARRRFALVLGLVYARALLTAAQYLFGKRAAAEVRIGTSGYGF